MVITQRGHAEAAHLLPFHNGKCRNLHGHSYDIYIEVDFNDSKLDSNGMFMDFSELKAVIDFFDYTYLNELPMFDHLHPTAENFANIIANLVASSLPDLTDSAVINVTLREGLGDHWVRHKLWINQDYWDGQ